MWVIYEKKSNGYAYPMWVFFLSNPKELVPYLHHSWLFLCCQREDPSAWIHPWAQQVWFLATLSAYWKEELSAVLLWAIAHGNHIPESDKIPLSGIILTFHAPEKKWTICNFTYRADIWYICLLISLLLRPKWEII